MRFITGLASMLSASLVVASPVGHLATAIDGRSAVISKRFDCPFGSEPCQFAAACDVQASLDCTVKHLQSIADGFSPSIDALVTALNESANALLPLPESLADPLVHFTSVQAAGLQTFVLNVTGIMTDLVNKIVDDQEAILIPGSMAILNQSADGLLNIIGILVNAANALVGYAS